MGMRIRVLAGCFAMGVTALLLTGTAAQAAPQSGAHVSAGVSLPAIHGGREAGGNAYTRADGGDHGPHGRRRRVGLPDADAGLRRRR